MNWEKVAAYLAKSVSECDIELENLKNENPSQARNDYYLNIDQKRSIFAVLANALYKGLERRL